MELQGWLSSEEGSDPMTPVTTPGDLLRSQKFEKRELEQRVASLAAHTEAQGGLDSLPQYVQEYKDKGEWTKKMMKMIDGFDRLKDSEKKKRRSYLQDWYEKKDENPEEYHRHNVKLREIYDYADEFFVDPDVLKDVEDLIKEKNKDISEGFEDSDPIKDPWEIPYEYDDRRVDLIDPDKVNDISNGLREIYWEEIRQKDRDAGELDEFIQYVFQLDDLEFLRNSKMIREAIRQRNQDDIKKKRKVEWDWD
jgi:hypothetical protein